MQTSLLLAQHFRQVYFGGNWTSVSLRETLNNVDWKQAAFKVSSCNTIAALVFHIGYYVSAVAKVLEGGPLDAHDKFSYEVPDIKCDEDWQSLLQKTWTNAEKFAALVEQLPDSTLQESMADPKYGSWHRNLLGIIEHTHYHLGQIVIIKKMV